MKDDSQPILRGGTSRMQSLASFGPEQPGTPMPSRRTYGFNAAPAAGARAIRFLVFSSPGFKGLGFRGFRIWATRLSHGGLHAGGTSESPRSKGFGGPYKLDD